MCGQHHVPAAFTAGKDTVPIVQEAGWAPEPVWIGAENLAPLGFDPRTFQPVASLDTDYAIPAPWHWEGLRTNATNFRRYSLCRRRNSKWEPVDHNSVVILCGPVW